MSNSIQWDAIKALFHYRRLPLQKIIDRPTQAWDAVSKYMGDARITEKGAEIPLVLTRGHGTGPRLPSYRSPVVDKATFDIYDQYTIVEIEDRVKDIYDQLVNMSTTSLQVQEANLKFNLARMLFGDGSGVFAVVASIAQDKSYIVVNPTLCNATNYPLAAFPNFYQGMLIDTIVAANGNVRDAAVQVVKAEIVSGAVRVYGSFTNTQAGDLVCLSGSYNLEFPGLSAIVSATTSYGGISPSTYPQWAGYVFDLNNGDLTRGILYQFTQNLFAHSGGGKITHILTTPAVAAKYGELATDITRIVFSRPSEVKNSAGYGNLVYNSMISGWGEIPIITDPLCPEGSMFFVDANNINRYYVRPFNWIEGEDEFGGVFRSKVVAGSTNLVALGYTRFVIFTGKRNAHGRLVNIKVS